MSHFVNIDRFMKNLRELAAIGKLHNGGVCRAALSPEDALAREWLGSYVKKLGLEVKIDQVGNMFAILPGSDEGDAVVTGSHLDTVFTGGIYDGSLGVLAGLEVMETILEKGFSIKRPLVVANFTNEEGVRFTPDMMGSLAFSRAVPVEEIWNAKSLDGGTTVKDELETIGYLGAEPIGFFRPHAYVELHIEQGPVLEQLEIPIGLVEGVQGISWTRYSFSGQSAHSGTTPLENRRDSLLFASRVIREVYRIAKRFGGTGTVGSIVCKPNAINVVAEDTSITVDMRNPDKEILFKMKEALDGYIAYSSGYDRITCKTDQLVFFDPVRFDKRIIDILEKECDGLGLSCKRMISGAGHDAQLMAGVCPSAMIFVPSVGGISHNTQEHTRDEDLVNGVNLLFKCLLTLANE